MIILRSAKITVKSLSHWLPERPIVIVSTTIFDELMTGTPAKSLVSHPQCDGNFGAANRDRTCDIWFTKPMLYQLSYHGVTKFWSARQDLNLRSLAPKASALPGYATHRHFTLGLREEI